VIELVVTLGAAAAVYVWCVTHPQQREQDRDPGAPS
jgi:hypothetical protein